MILRYPGGKSRGALCKRIVGLIKERYTSGVFSEPFFGGGGITLQLLKESAVDEVVINDYDRSLADLWNSVILEPGELSRRVKLFKPTVEKFLRLKQDIIDNTKPNLGFSFLVVNRLSHAGRGVKAGPQGGIKQTGKYKIDCRWNPETLSTNIWKLHKLLTGAGVTRCYNNSYERMLDQGAFHYFDPPYWEVGQELYRCAFTEEEHVVMRDNLAKMSGWVLSYNNHPSVIAMYSKFDMEVSTTAGNGGEKRNSEVIIWN